MMLFSCRVSNHGPILMREVVEKRSWLSEEDLVEGFALAQSLPGIVAVNAAVFVGHHIKGLAGAAMAAAASILPAIIGSSSFFLAEGSLYTGPLLSATLPPASIRCRSPFSF